MESVTTQATKMVTQLVTWNVKLDELLSAADEILASTVLESSKVRSKCRSGRTNSVGTPCRQPLREDWSL